MRDWSKEPLRPETYGIKQHNIVLYVDGYPYFLLLYIYYAQIWRHENFSWRGEHFVQGGENQGV